jgi:hypothetical protein
MGIYGAGVCVIRAINLLFSVTKCILHKCRLNFSLGTKRTTGKGAWLLLL